MNDSMEESRFESKLWMTSIFNSLDEAVLVVTPERVLVNVNQAAMNIFGYSIEQIMGSSTELFHVDHAHYLEFGRKIKEAFDDDQPASFEFVAKRKNGEIFPSEHTVTLLKDPDGTPLGIVSVVRDITERKKVEDELENYREHLEELVRERTNKIETMQNELVRKERLATLGLITATISHEIRNPLSAMFPALYTLKSKFATNSDKLVAKSIERLERNISRCDRIIDELLNYSRVRDLSWRTTKIDEWFNAVIDSLDVPQGVQITKSLSLGGIDCEIDRDLLLRAVLNIFDNACQSMQDDKNNLLDKSAARIEFSSREGGERIELAVSDSGSGIADGVLPNIFEPLYSTKSFGVGLGMPTVRQIMLQHDGGVEIDTKVGMGTTVILWLPINR